ncbi:DUF4817 domain-containing protein [Trichonephila inaurata madagascariensis]|uniref:DUF4817 domain-containing protein n=1 Tax=Trichonephila inaurata madagascariensis TaxID=2747483 RepID=A0A8X6XZ99_9ARAC|nr:DUF4817 domain-containing protein [Trichonephila inaurata madagascariensis]
MVPTKPQKAFCAVKYEKTMYVITVQRNYRREFGVDPPDKNSIKGWYTQLVETGCLYKGKNTGRPRSEEIVDRVRQFFLGVSSCFLVNFRNSLHTGYLEKNKEKWCILFLPLQETCWGEHVRKWNIT